MYSSYLNHHLNFQEADSVIMPSKLLGGGGESQSIYPDLAQSESEETVETARLYPHLDKSINTPGTIPFQFGSGLDPSSPPFPSSVDTCPDISQFASSNTSMNTPARTSGSCKQSGKNKRGKRKKIGRTPKRRNLFGSQTMSTGSSLDCDDIKTDTSTYEEKAAEDQRRKFKRAWDQSKWGKASKKASNKTYANSDSGAQKVKEAKSRYDNSTRGASKVKEAKSRYANSTRGASKVKEARYLYEQREKATLARSKKQKLISYRRKVKKAALHFGKTRFDNDEGKQDSASDSSSDTDTGNLFESFDTRGDAMKAIRKFKVRNFQKTSLHYKYKIYILL